MQELYIGIILCYDHTPGMHTFDWTCHFRFLPFHIVQLQNVYTITKPIRIDLISEETEIDMKTVDSHIGCTDYMLRKVYPEWDAMFPLLKYEKVFDDSYYRDPLSATFVYLNEWIHTK